MTSKGFIVFKCSQKKNFIYNQKQHWYVFAQTRTKAKGTLGINLTNSIDYISGRPLIETEEEKFLIALTGLKVYYSHINHHITTRMLRGSANCFRTKKHNRTKKIKAKWSTRGES